MSVRSSPFAQAPRDFTTRCIADVLVSLRDCRDQFVLNLRFRNSVALLRDAFVVLHQSAHHVQLLTLVRDPKFRFGETQVTVQRCNFCRRLCRLKDGVSMSYRVTGVNGADVPVAEECEIQDQSVFIAWNFLGYDES